MQRLQILSNLYLMNFKRRVDLNLNSQPFVFAICQIDHVKLPTDKTTSRSFFFLGGHPLTTWIVQGEVVRQTYTLLHKPYLVKVTTKGEEGQKYPKIWSRGLLMSPSLHFSYLLCTVGKMEPPTTFNFSIREAYYTSY